MNPPPPPPRELSSEGQPRSSLPPPPRVMSLGGRPSHSTEEGSGGTSNTNTTINTNMREENSESVSAAAAATSGRIPPPPPRPLSYSLPLPPPPPPRSGNYNTNISGSSTAAAAAAATTTTATSIPHHQQQHQQHQSVLTWPSLESAPSSANALAAAAAMAADQFSSAVMDFSSMAAAAAVAASSSTTSTTNSSSITMMGSAAPTLGATTIPPFPATPNRPPPPPRDNLPVPAASAEATAATVVANSFIPLVTPRVPPPPLPQPTIVALPPPPPHTTPTSSSTPTPSLPVVSHPDKHPIPWQPPPQPPSKPPPFLNPIRFRNHTNSYGNNTANSNTNAPKQQQQRTSSQFSQQPSTTVTASRQERIPVLFVATERAHAMAWKNGVRLSDLWQGVWSTTTTSADGLAPFRTLNNRSMPLQWDQLALQFMEGDRWTHTNHTNNNNIDKDENESSSVTTGAEEKLQQAAALQDQDGNLQEELALLEDQIDNMLPDQDTNNNNNNNAASATGGTLSSSTEATMPPPGYNQARRIDQHKQAIQDAYRLTSPLSIPWLWRYRQAADECTDFLSHEQFHFPAVIVTVCSTAEEDSGGISETLHALQLNHHYLPIQFRNGLFDPESIRREVLVLHDNAEGPKDWDETALRHKIQASFGIGAVILRINSLASETAAILATEEQHDLWGGGGALGNCLTVADRARMRKYLTNLVSFVILPALERRIADLNVLVSDRKKGVKNVLKSLWGGSSSRKRDDDDTAAASTMALANSSFATTAGATIRNEQDIKYRFDSVESQARLLADTLFLMRDYDAAHSTYRLIKDDFKQDRNWTHYASVQEMMALCLYMSDPYGRTKDIFSCIENALLSYSRAAAEETAALQMQGNSGRQGVAPIATRLATRLCLVLIATRNICSGRHLEVADLLASASSQENALGAAVLLEQSSAHYYKAEMYRKYAFHMLMAGHMFRTAEQDHHAFRCFTSALYIYRESNFDVLHNHVRSALASQLFTMNRMVVSLQLYAKLLGCKNGGSVSVKSQQKFVNNLLEICNDHGKKALAGADQMAAKSSITGAARDAVRKDRLDRIVQVIRYTKTASRVLELPHMNLPSINDSTVSVIADETALQRQESIPSFGEANSGSPEVWEELQLTTLSEIKAASMKENIAMKTTLEEIASPAVRRVIAMMDEEKSSRLKMARPKNQSELVDNIPVRSVREPISVMFTITNPLGIPIDLHDLQLVAKMKAEHDDSLCTNEDAVRIRPLAAANEADKWFFQNSNVQYEIADFCRVSTGQVDSESIAWKSAEDVTPFFVVTKRHITLATESEAMISTSICPLTSGQLEILGVRYRLFNSIWIYHPFDIKGPLLQNTRANRANRVRGISYLLTSKVEDGMPCFSINLVSSDSGSVSNDPVLQNQISEWILRVNNVGTSAGTNLLLKTSLPWINVLDGSDNERVDDNSATSFCTGPTGTLMSLRLSGSTLATEGQIQPGESIDVPIQIRASETGKRDFYMLFRYETLSGFHHGEPPRFRWLKKMFQVPIYPSLSLSAIVNVSSTATLGHVLSVEVTNCRTDRPDDLEITLENFSIASRHYFLERLHNHSGLDSQATLGWQERTLHHFRLSAKVDGDERPLLTQCPVSDNNIRDTGSLCSLAFLCLERSHANFQQECKLHQMALDRAAAQGDGDNQPRSIASIRRANTVDMARDVTALDGDKRRPHPTSIHDLCPPEGDAESIHLLCSWGIKSGAISGLHHIRDLLVRPISLNSAGCPITITALYAPSVRHNFNKGPAVVPLEVTIQNLLTKSPVSLDFTVDRPESFDFNGPEKLQFELGVGGLVKVPLKALLPTAGVYNLQKVRLCLRNGEMSPLPLVLPLQWMVAVDSE